MDVTAEDAAQSGRSAAVGTAAAAAKARRSWSVVNLDSEHQTTVLVTRWRLYAAWWAASLRIFDGNDMRIRRTR